MTLTHGGAPCAPAEETAAEGEHSGLLVGSLRTPTAFPFSSGETTTCQAVTGITKPVKCVIASS